MPKLPPVDSYNAPGVLQTGSYKVTITEAEDREKGLLVVYQITGSKDLARQYFSYDTVHGIGLRQLRGLLDAVGLPPSGADTDDLIGKKLIIFLTYSPGEQYPINVRRCSPIDSNVECLNSQEEDDDLPF